MKPNVTARPGTVVVGYDGSEHAELALRWAADEAALEGRPLSIVHVIRPLEGYELSALAGTWVPPDEIRDAIWKGAEDDLNSARDALVANMPDLDVELVLLNGDARQVLLDLSRSASSLFLGSRGRGPVASLLLGSVSVAVSRAAQCPTFVIRPHHPGRVRNGVLVGTDCTERTRTTLEFAYRQASLRQLPLTVVRCVGTKLDSGDEYGGLVEDYRAGFDEERRGLAEAVAGLSEKFPDVPLRLRIGLGLPDTVLVNESARMDLVVVGHHKGRATGDLMGLGSFVTPVVEGAACPVAVVADRGGVAR